VLGLLADGEQSGYDLKRRVARSVGYFWAPARSQIYAVLPRLVGQGLVRGREVRQSGRPDKQLYRITKAGRAALRAWLDLPVEAEPGHNVLLLKLFFGDHGDREVMLEHVRARRREAEQLKEELLEIEARTPRTSDDLFPSLTRHYGLEYADALIRWADWAERKLG
jgi:PadR family transcriptional regulator, regulatory protein AphA